MNRSIALVGNLGSGKSTVALQMRLRGYVQHSWAQGVRDIFSMAYDQITPENYADIKQRVYTVRRPGIEGYVHVSGRELLQRIGTEAMRDQIDLDFWIRAGLGRIDALNDDGGQRPIVNDDTRFLNEAEALRDRGFLIVRIIRNDGPQYSTHPSEVEQGQIVADLTLYNFGSKDDLARTVNGAIPWFCAQCGHPDGEESKGYFGSVHSERTFSDGYWWCDECNADDLTGPCR